MLVAAALAMTILPQALLTAASGAEAAGGGTMW